MPATWTVDEALKYVREVGGAKETVYLMYVLDPETQQLAHVVSLRQLLQAPCDARVGDIGDRRAPLVVTPRMPREDVARLVSKYNVLAVPVIDEARHILGIVTVDDIIDAIVREQTEDVQKFGGLQALDEPYTEITFGRMIRKRAGWLCALFLSEMLTATAMQHFEGEIAKAVVLSMFIPLVMSSGGNSGSQATSLIIRALALREVKLRDWWRIALRELPTGLTLGAILGVIGFTRIESWQHLHLFNYGVHHLRVALTVACALVGIVGFGSLAGSMLPFLLERLGFDPASASAPFVATLVDVTGLVIYFSVAMVILRGTLL
jgi:magnesium transporter